MPLRRGSARILIVDDEHDVALTFKIGLELNGFTVDMFTNPLLALSKFKKDYYRLVLLDIRMPYVTGFQLYSEIAKRDKNVKVCFTTSFVSYYEGLLDEYHGIKNPCFIPKPVSITELVKCIELELNNN